VKGKVRRMVTGAWLDCWEQLESWPERVGSGRPPSRLSLNVDKSSPLISLVAYLEHLDGIIILS
jgi:hypothetical protein